MDVQWCAGWNFTPGASKASRDTVSLDLNWSFPKQLQDQSPSDLPAISAWGSSCPYSCFPGGVLMSLSIIDAPTQLPARMLNEYTYCPRLFYLEYVQGEWAHSADTLDGRFIHRRVDQEKGGMPAPGDPDDIPK